MKTTYLIAMAFNLVSFTNCSQQFVKQYFFGSPDFYRSNPELVVIVDHPQTKLAEAIGNRYYNDTTFLQRIAREFYTLTDTSNHETAAHMCGYDLFFYTKRGNNLQLLNRINSKCDLSETAGLDAPTKCTNLETLLESGTPLTIDTLHTPLTANRREEMLQGLIYYKNVEVDPISSFITARNYFWSHPANCFNLPVWYYDGSIVQKVPIDTSLSLDINIERHLSKWGIYDLTGKTINWRLDPSHAESLILYEIGTVPLPHTLTITFYLTSDYFHYFESETIKPVDPQVHTTFKSNWCGLVYQLPDSNK